MTVLGSAAEAVRRRRGAAAEPPRRRPCAPGWSRAGARSRLQPPRSTPSGRAACPDAWAGCRVAGSRRVDRAATSRRGGPPGGRKRAERRPPAHRSSATRSHAGVSVSRPTTGMARVDGSARSVRACVGGCWQRRTHLLRNKICAAGCDNRLDDAAQPLPAASRRPPMPDSRLEQRGLRR